MAPAIKKTKLRTARDVISRLRWSPSDYNENSDNNNDDLILMGYMDRIESPMEKSTQGYVSAGNGGDIPEHRILYFRRALEPVEENILWDRAGRVDRIFGSGKGGDAAVAQETIDAVRQAIATMIRIENNKNKKRSLKTLSHNLSWALRHAAPQLNLTMTADGFCPLEEILQSTHPKLNGWTEQEIRQVVETNDKQRFRLDQKLAAEYAASSPQVVEAASPDTASAAMIWCIRANQGHSIAGINPHLLLERLSKTDVAALPCIVHGTYREPWNTIEKVGYLSRMKRNHIHCASGLLGENGVISGMRRTCQVYIYMDGAKCARDGIVFFRSDNGVILTEGVDGELPVTYVSHVTDDSGQVLLDQWTH
jgi:2'-phosphotransferase